MPAGAEPPSGIAVVDKPAGLTSHQVVGRARRLLGTRKVGHAGTLDPMATGVLVLGVGRATRLLGQLSLTDKAYLATIRLGQTTVTDDAEGEITAAHGARALSDAAIDDALARFRGRIQQVPSAVSAIKIGGVRSYARVRSGAEVELAARSVTVSRFDVLARRDVAEGPLPDRLSGSERPALDLPLAGLPLVDLDVVVHCSAGTYVRALARDLGAALGTGGHLTALRRTRVGPFTQDDAQPLDGAGLVVSDIAAVARRCFPALELGPEGAAAVRVGRRLSGVELPAQVTAVFGPDRRFLALYRPDGPDAVPVAVFVG